MLVQLEHVRKKYGSFTLELNMQIPEDRIIGLIGANGAGKSTTFKLMLGLIRPDRRSAVPYKKSRDDDIKVHLTGFLIVYDLFHDRPDQITFFFITHIRILKYIIYGSDFFQYLFSVDR